MRRKNILWVRAKPHLNHAMQPKRRAPVPELLHSARRVLLPRTVNITHCIAKAYVIF